MLFTALAPLVLMGLLPQDPAVVTEGRLRAHVRFLSHDLLEGRATPSRGLDLAAVYIAGEFEKIGLEPAGPEGSWFQETDYTSRRGDVSGKVRNVIGKIRGADPVLANEAIIVSAHYDHLGTREGEGDQIFNGANDDASGVAGVIEVANMLAKAKPSRSIIFMCFWGEERGLLGSRFYAQSPVVPLKNTIAMVNLEQIGRTDDSEGARVGEFNLTGFDFTDMASVLSEAAKPHGIKVTKHEQNSDAFFTRSDNAALAIAGIPAHTISTAYTFPDYHRQGDEWNKLNYPNFLKIVRSIGAGVKAIADRKEPIKWNESNEKTASFVKAWKELHGG